MLGAGNVDDVRFGVVENSYLRIEGTDVVSNIEAFGFSNVRINVEVDTLSLSGFSQAYSGGRRIDTLVCDATSDARCAPGAAGSSSCEHCPAMPAGS